MKIALIGSRDVQQFPTISYGGIETCVENLAWGLQNNNQEFTCIVPRREDRAEYPFDYQRFFEYSRRFHVNFEIQALLKKSERILTGH
jgi:hypothetical protein